MTIHNIGLIINPMAGIGGRVGLKGSDGRTIQRRAIALGATPGAPLRAQTALDELSPMRDSLSVAVYPGEMGEDVLRRSGFTIRVIGDIDPGRTTASDTRQAATEMSSLSLRLILFAGGDGTARDIASVIGTQIPVVGIPAGVKMHSAVFANKPNAAGDLVRLVLEGRVTRFREAEVMDLDEKLYRRGLVVPKLFGFLKVPLASGLVQSQKRPSSMSEADDQAAIASWVCENMESDRLYVLGPGTTTRTVATFLGVEKTLIGVDVLENGKVILADANEDQLLELLSKQKAAIIVSPIGGQGHLFGRGNQQISHRVITRVGSRNIIAVCSPEKLHSLEGKPLLVDSGDAKADADLAGFIRVITGYKEQAVYRVAS
jgi:predicted polyphosphate/ATP-dependent NAD kinase